MLYIDSNHEPSPCRILGVHSNGEFYEFKLLHMNLADHKITKSSIPQREHVHNVYHVTLFRQGEGEFLLDGQPKPCRVNTLVLTSPGQPHDFGPVAGGELVISELTFSFLNRSGAALKIPYHELLSQQFGHPLPVLPMPLELPEWKAEQLFGLFESCYRALEMRGENGEVYVATAFLRVFLTVTEFLMWLGKNEVKEKHNMRLLKIKDFIENNLNRQLNLEELSRKCCMEPSYFCRIFKSQYGCSPVEYAIRCRIEAAKSLLISTGLSCKDIAELTGFKDPVYFSRVFKKRCSKTPLQYRYK